MQVKLEIVKGVKKDSEKAPFDVSCLEPEKITVGRCARKSEKYGDKYPHIQISAEDLRLSRWHFMLQLSPPNCFICDMGSTNHTYVNVFQEECHIKGNVELKNGDTIKAGRTYLKVHLIPDKPGEPAATRCVDCGREIKEIERRHPEDIGTRDFVCKECLSKRKYIWPPMKEEGKRERFFRRKPEKPEKKIEVRGEERMEEKEIIPQKVEVDCFHCSRNVTNDADKDGRAEELRDVALYLCKECAQKERVMKEKIGEYVFLKQIGAGGMGVVYKGWHQTTGRITAIKELLPDKLMDEKSLKVFHREISVTHSLIHPNIVRFYDSFSKKGKPYLITEYLSGGNAEEKLTEQKGPFTIDTACRIILEILEGLTHAHKKGIVHRDISPNNILFDDNGRAKLSDMGLAKSFELAGQSGITVPGDFGGKILYVAPEQILDYCFVKPPADVYSAGVCLYYFLTGKFPFNFPSQLDLLMGLAGLKKVKQPFAIVLEDDPIPILERKPDLPKPLAAIIDRCLRKKQEERFKDGGELATVIRKGIE